jgi:hypothetical protein
MRAVHTKLNFFSVRYPDFFRSKWWAKPFEKCMDSILINMVRKNTYTLTFTVFKHKGKFSYASFIQHKCCKIVVEYS